MSVKKFNYINHSIPLARRKKTFESYEAMMKCIDDERLVEEVLMTDFIHLSFDTKTSVYCLEAEIDEDGVKKTAKIDCPAFSIAMLFRDILDVGDITKLIETSTKVDAKLPRIWDDIVGVSRPSTKNLDDLNEVFRSLWDVKRTKNTRTKTVYIYRVYDFATASEDGDGRAIVTGAYVHYPDAEVMKIVKTKAQEVNSNIEYQKGYATALMSRASFVDTHPRVSGEREVLVGVTCANSEFKYSGLHLNSYLYVPEYDIELIGKTKRLTVSFKHTGNPKTFEQMIKTGVETVLGMREDIIEIFNRVKTCESRAIAIDFGKESVDGKNLLGTELGMTSKIKQLVKIKEDRGFPSDIEGVVLTLMDYSTHYIDDENERDRVNQTIMRIIERPDSFVQSLGERITRAEAIELEADEPDPEPENSASLGLEEWI